MGTRKGFAGAASATTIAAGVSAGATSFVVADATGWPGTVPFVAVIDRGLSSEEKVLVGARSGTTFSSITRGYDGTADQSHATNCAVEHILDAVTVDEANSHATDSDVTAHAASKITFTPTGAVAASTVQAAIAELDSDLTAHLNDTVDAHDASAISFAAAGNIAAATVQAAIEELDTEKSGTAHTHDSTTLDANAVGTSEIQDGAVTKAKIETAQQMPAGVMMAYGGAAAPTGWLLCDGTAVSRTTYADLFAAIGTAYGTGDGSTTFNLPDLRQRVPLGKAASGTGSTLGGSGGSKDAVTVAHSHDDGTLASASSGTHDHSSVDGNVFTVSIGGVQSHRIPAAGSTTDGAYVTFTSVDDEGAHTHDVTGSTASAGVSGTDANLPPYQVVNWIVKT